MRIWLISLAAGMMMGAGAGCRSQPMTPAKRASLQAKHWRQARAYDQQRLKGWDHEPAGLWGVLVDLWQTPGELIAHYSGDTPAAAVKNMHNPNAPDQRRVGILYLTDRAWGRQGVYLEAYRQTALNDPDDLVRATAVRALNRARDHGAVPVFIQALEDKSDLVRVEAAKALANIPDKSAADALARHLADPTENKDVRIAAADALREYKMLQVAQSLIRQLSDREFAVAWQSRISLWFMTGRDFEYDQAGWLGYITGPGNPLG
jgi:hypothetical protein